MPQPDLVVRQAAADRAEECVDLWVVACAARDGQAQEGVAERARPKFGDKLEALLVAERDDRLVGFAVITRPGSGFASDPADAAILGLLATEPALAGHGIGSALLDAVAGQLRTSGRPRAVLHVLVDNGPAVRLYTSRGWRPFGSTFQHSLLKRPVQSYVLDLEPTLQASSGSGGPS